MQPIEPSSGPPPPPPPPPPPEYTGPPGGVWGQPYDATADVAAAEPDDGLLPALPAEVRQVGWGMGDVALGFALWLGMQIAVGIGIVSIFIALGTVPDDPDQLTTNLWVIGSGVIGSALAFIGWPYIVAKWKGLGSLVRDFGLKITLADVGWGVLAGIACLVLSVAGNVVYEILFGGTPPSNAEFIEKADNTAINFVVMFLLVAVVTPISEEIFFRGLVLRSAAKTWGTATAIVVSSIIFGLPHAGAATSWSSLAFFPFVTALYGAVLAFTCIRCNWRLGPTIVAHMVINGTGVAAAFFLDATT